MNDKLDSIEKKLDKFIDSVDERFAGKWVEKDMKKYQTIIIIAVIMALLALVITK